MTTAIYDAITSFVGAACTRIVGSRNILVHIATAVYINHHIESRLRSALGTGGGTHPVVDLRFLQVPQHL